MVRFAFIPLQNIASSMKYNGSLTGSKNTCYLIVKLNHAAFNYNHIITSGFANIAVHIGCGIVVVCASFGAVIPLIIRINFRNMLACIIFAS